MNEVFIVTDVRIDEREGSANHVWELFENLQRFADAYLLAPFAEERPDHDRVFSIRGDLVPIPVLQTVLFRSLFLLAITYQTVRRSPAAFYVRHSPLMVLPAAVAKAFGRPLVVEVNSILADEHGLSGKRLWMTWVIRADERLTFRLADRFVAVTPQIATHIHRRYGVPKSRIACVPNGANVELFRPLDEQRCKAELGLDLDASYVCFVGNLAPWQGLQHLLRSAPSVLSAVPDAKFLIVGDGIQRTELEELTAELGIEDDVLFTGSVPYETVPRYVNASDACVVYKKPMDSGYSPLKLFEYMACGRPVVASDTEGFGVLEETDAGVLVRPEDPDALADALTELLRDGTESEAMGENGRAFVVERRSWKATAEKVADVVQAAMREHYDDV